MGGAAVRQNRSGATCKYRRHPLTPQPDAAVAEGKDSSVQRHEATVVHPCSDQPPLDAQVEQLPPRDHSVLALSQLADRAGRLIIRLHAFSSYRMSNACRRGAKSGHGTHAGG
jgi:hypothetical protein